MKKIKINNLSKLYLHKQLLILEHHDMLVPLPF